MLTQQALGKSYPDKFRVIKHKRNSLLFQGNEKEIPAHLCSISNLIALFFYSQAGKHRLFLNILLFWKLPAPNIVKESMMYFVDNYNHTQYKSIFEKVAINHIQFEQIPPFEDGNCRTGRLLINFELLKNNIAPIVIPKEERTKYRHQ